MLPHLKEPSFTERAISKKEQVAGGFPGGSVVKESACNAGDPRFDPWVGKIPWRMPWQPTPGTEPGFPALQADSLLFEPLGKPSPYCKLSHNESI